MSARIFLLMTPLSLYLHLPFCAKKCRYCDFYSVKTDEHLVKQYLVALSREIDLYHDHAAVVDAQVQTVFFGGGTPSVLSPEDLAGLCGLIRSRFSLAPNVEWTVECNPESFSNEKGELLLGQGVTRLTFGIQSLDDRELSLLGRIHSAQRCIEVLSDPMLLLFSSVGADIIYGIPGQTVASLNRTISGLLALPLITHISAYELNIADGTPFGRHQSRIPVPDEDTMISMTHHVWDHLITAGFEQYEVSNFARPGYRCRHNEVYWDHNTYLGLGPAAHSYFRTERWANVRDIERYCIMVEAGELPREFTEILDPQKLAEEMVFLGLRKAQGIDENLFYEKCGKIFTEIVDSQKLEYYQSQGLIQYQKPFWQPTMQGMLVADGMARELCPAH
jgi:oxygen-independent coproporphyrinogen-3 oxidase